MLCEGTGSDSTNGRQGEAPCVVSGAQELVPMPWGAWGLLSLLLCTGVSTAPFYYCALTWIKKYWRIYFIGAPSTLPEA